MTSLHPESDGSLVATICVDTKKASLSWTDNEALKERVRRIEPPPTAWEAVVLPLNYTRKKWLGEADRKRLRRSLTIPVAGESDKPHFMPRRRLDQIAS